MSQRMKRGWLWLAAAVLMVAGCTPPAVSTTGSVQLVAMVEAVTADAVSRVLVTVTAPDMEPLTATLVKTGSTWSGTLTAIPVGSNRTFTAEAFDAAGTKLFAGEAKNVTITGGTTAVVNITLQETGPGTGFENDAPRITSLVASTNRVAAGGTVALQVTAMDPNTGDTLSYAWTASAGGFDNPTGTVTTWTAPPVAGSATVTVTVTDSRGASATLAITFTVEGGSTPDAGVGGSASVGATLNSWPRVTRITAAPSFIAPGETTTAEATASDVDGDALSYSWSAGCGGAWTNPNSRTATFTVSEFGVPPSPDGCGSCPLYVTVTDGRGGQTTGSLRMCVGTKPVPSFPPRISSTSSSVTTVATGGNVTLRVTASDPMGGSLTFSWAAARGTLGTPLSGVASSELVWTAPSCVPSTGATAYVVATVKNTAGLSTPATFPITLTGPACPPSSWISTSPLATRRGSHTATTLASGQVLVAGGNGTSDVLALSELYDPVTSLWRRTGSMNMPRTYHSATRLASGKVLVAGGYSWGFSISSSAELYDPASGTWTPVASMSRARAYHAATLLPSGKVLVVGGNGSVGDLSDAEVYDPATNTWSLGGYLLTARGYGVSVQLLPSGKVLIAGGTSFTHFMDLYDPVADTWGTLFPDRTHVRPLVALLRSGRVLVADMEGSPRYAELYDPATNNWSPTGSTGASRSNGAAVTLASGMVLMAGGYDSSGTTTLATAELYDPAMGTWSPVGSLGLARQSFAMVPLASGAVLAVGGWTTSSPLDSVELFLP